MDSAQATQILQSSIASDGGLYNVGWYLAWSQGDATATLDGTFTADDLEAIAWWMRQHKDNAP